MTKPARTASHSAACIDSSLSPCTTVSVAVSATFPRQASCPSAFWVGAGTRPNFAAMRSATLSVKPLARMRGTSQAQARVPGSNPRSVSSFRASKNWMVKKGLPSVFSNTRPAKGRTRSRSVCRASASSRSTSSGFRAEQDLPHHAAGSADPRQHPRERVRRADLVVAIGTDQEQVPHVGVEDEVLDQFEGRAIQPLQVVEEQRERVLRACKHAEKTPEHQLEPILPFLLRELRNRRLLADDESQLGDEVDHELAVRAKRIEQRGAPLAHAHLAFAEGLPDKRPAALNQRRLTDDGLVLI